jgi:demethylmenaquinone methyltransferase/2-methoxy-6-polyprenyl-1,4-benzoquinol methylase
MNTPENLHQQRRTYDRAYVSALFDSIAFRYDTLNHVLSSALDVLWRRKAIRLLKPLQAKSILDVATGTADFAIAAARLHPERIVGIDISSRMLERGTKKISGRHLEKIISLELGEAEQMRFSSEAFDAVTVAFGVRNFSDLEKGLSEIYRVLRPGGAAVILEFSTPKRFPIAQLYAFYSRTVLPQIGGLLTHNRKAYEYLPSTIAEFPDGDEFTALLLAAGFASVQCFPLTFGIASIYLAAKAGSGQ